MESIILKDLFCELCALQFNKKAVYDMHLSLVHKKAQDIKKEHLYSDENLSFQEQEEETCKAQKNNFEPNISTIFGGPSAMTPSTQMEMTSLTQM